MAEHNITQNGVVPEDDPFFISSGDHTGHHLIPFQLNGASNYHVWSTAIQEGLLVKNKICFIDGSCPKNSVPAARRAKWEKANAIVKAWLRNTVCKDLVSGLAYNTTAQSIWDDLKEMFGKVDGTQIFEITREIYHTFQGTLSITEYFAKMKQLWDALASIDETIMECETDMAKHSAGKEQQKLISFLLGLNDTFANARSTLLMRQPLPSLSVAYSVLITEERQRSISSAISDGVLENTTALYSVRGNASSVQGNARFANARFNNRGKNIVHGAGPSNASNNAATGGYSGIGNSAAITRGSGSNSGFGRGKVDKSGWFCTYCRRYGHLIDTCWVKNGLPENLKRKRVIANGVVVDDDSEATPAANTIHVAAPSSRVVHAASSSRIAHVAAANHQTDPLQFNGEEEDYDDYDYQEFQANMAGPLQWEDYEDWD